MSNIHPNWHVNPSLTYHAVIGTAQDSSAIKKLRSKSSKKFKVLIKKHKKLIQVTGDEADFASLPYISEIIRTNYEKGLVKGNFSVITLSTDGSLLFIKFNDWLVTTKRPLVFNRDIQEDDFVFYPEGLNLHTIIETVTHDVTEEVDLSLYKNFIEVSPTHESVKESEYRLRNLSTMIIKNKKLIGASLIAALTIGVGVFAYDFYQGLGDRAIHRTEYIVVDEYEQYKNRVKEIVTVSDISEPMLASYLFLKSLPYGWATADVYYESGPKRIKSVIKHSNGTISSLRELKRSHQNGKWLQIQGQNVVYDAPLENKTTGTEKTIPLLKNVRQPLIDRMVSLGAKVSSNKPVDAEFYSTQKLGFTFERVNAAIVQTISEALKDIPTNVLTFKMTNKEKSIETIISFDVEIFGEKS